MKRSNLCENTKRSVKWLTYTITGMMLALASLIVFSAFLGRT